MQSWKRPQPADLWRAIETYLAYAYDGPPPGAVRSRLATLRATPAAELFASPIFECIEQDGATVRYSIRLGNRFYPHMKLAIEPIPAGHDHLYRVDTHDRHVRPPPGSPEERAFADLMSNNQSLAESIESAWEQAGLPTFKAYLREDLARRAQSSGAH